MLHQSCSAWTNQRVLGWVVLALALLLLHLQALCPLRLGGVQHMRGRQVILNDGPEVPTRPV